MARQGYSTSMDVCQCSFYFRARFSRWCSPAWPQFTVKMNMGWVPDAFSIQFVSYECEVACICHNEKEFIQAVVTIHWVCGQETLNYATVIYHGDHHQGQHFILPAVLALCLLGPAIVLMLVICYVGEQILPQPLALKPQEQGGKNRRGKKITLNAIGVQ